MPDKYHPHVPSEPQRPPEGDDWYGQLHTPVPLLLSEHASGDQSSRVGRLLARLTSGRLGSVPSKSTDTMPAEEDFDSLYDTRGGEDTSRASTAPSSSYEWEGWDDWSEPVDMPHVTERAGNNWRRKVGGALGVAAVGAALYVSGVFGTGKKSSDRPASFHGPALVIPKPSKKPMVKKPVISEVERLYKDSKLVIQDHPFKSQATVADQEEFAKDYKISKKNAGFVFDMYRRGNIDTVKYELDYLKARFKTAAQLTSGMTVNVYTSDLDNPAEPLDINLQALDVLVTETINLSQNVEGSPYNEEMAEIKQLADQGLLNLNISMVLLSDETLCIPGENKGKLPNKHLVNRNSVYCKGLGENVRGNSPGRITDQFIAVLDTGAEGPRNYYSASAQQLGKVLNPDEFTAVAGAHEIAHAFVGNTKLNHAYSGDEEHSRFVFKVESNAYKLVCKLDQDGTVSTIKPVHVEDDPTTTIPRDTNTPVEPKQ
jgi:hypothetical protein